MQYIIICDLSSQGFLDRTDSIFSSSFSAVVFFSSILGLALEYHFSTLRATFFGNESYLLQGLTGGLIIFNT
jgi:hypothetical protein